MNQPESNSDVVVRIQSEAYDSITDNHTTIVSIEDCMWNHRTVLYLSADGDVNSTFRPHISERALLKHHRKILLDSVQDNCQRYSPAPHSKPR